MADAVVGPPEAGTYAYVLRDQAGRDPGTEAVVTGYDGQVRTRDVTHPDGVRARTVFVASRYFADRLRSLGWLEVTEQWLAPAAPVAPVAPRKGRREPTSLEG